MVRVGRAAALVSVGVIVVAGGAGGAVRTGSPLPAPVAADAAPGDVDPEAAGGAVTLAFAGDVHFEGVLATVLRDDPAAVLRGVAPVLSAADVAVVNLETAITERGTPEPKEHTFRAPVTALDALAAGGVDVASMANNHGIDFGPVGLADSLSARAASTDVAVVGIGRDDNDAYGPHVVEVGDRRVAVVAATQVLDRRFVGTWTATAAQPGLASAKEVDRLLAAVRAAGEAADTVVVHLHWGVEKETCPSADQRGLAEVLVAAGADVVVGGHAHRVQGAGRLGPGLVGYGLGNFVFSTRPGAGATSGILVVTVDGGRVLDYRWVPARIVDGVPRLLEGDEAVAAERDWAALRGCTGLDP